MLKFEIIHIGPHMLMECNCGCIQPPFTVAIYVLSLSPYCVADVPDDIRVVRSFPTFTEFVSSRPHYLPSFLAFLSLTDFYFLFLVNL